MKNRFHQEERARRHGRGQSETGQLEALIGTQQATRTLGVIALDLTAPIAAMLPPVRRGAGAVVARVTPEAPYSQQGRLQPGDVIYALNGHPIANVEDLKNAAAASKPEDHATGLAGPRVARSSEVMIRKHKHVWSSACLCFRIIASLVTPAGGQRPASPHPFTR